jgi:SAM-dependent methyltransferase
MDVDIDSDGRETRAIHALVDFRDKSVLEIGAGDGRMTWRFAEGTRRVIAIDLRKSDIQRAIQTTPDHVRSKVRFLVADATTYRYPPDRFDVVVLSHSLCCLPSEGVVHVLQQVHRSLRADGVFLDVHPVPRPPTVEAWRGSRKIVIGSPDEGTATIRAARRQLERVISDGLFRVTARRWFDLHVHYSSVDGWLRRRDERGATSLIPNDLLAAARHEMRVPGTTLTVKERVRATALLRA